MQKILNYSMVDVIIILSYNMTSTVDRNGKHFSNQNNYDNKKYFVI